MTSSGALEPEAILALLQEQFPQTALETAENGAKWIRIAAEDLPTAARFLKTDGRLRFDSLMSLSGLDLSKYPGPQKGVFPSDELVCVYSLHSLTLRHKLTVKVFCPRENPAVPTVEDVWGVATYFEREIWDLYGVRFEGHHRLARIMCPEDWEGHPLRKDYKYPETYHEVPLRREGQTFTSGPYA